MQPGALAPYEQALRDNGPLGLRTATGLLVDLEVARWLAPVDAVDETVLDRCRGPVLDVGCGPGRFVSSLAARGIVALGVDIAETAVAMTRAVGTPVLRRDVFELLPGEGRWATVLLLDGNIGIGGDPARLLARTHSLLGPHGQLIVEGDADPDVHDRLDMRFTTHGEAIGPAFAWARVGRRPLLGYAAEAGYTVAESWSSGGRDFTVLERSRAKR